MHSISCPLCLQDAAYLWHTETRNPLKGREYWRCACCDLIFVPDYQQLDGEAEKAVYLLHENNPQDPGYRRFLSGLVDPLLPFLQKSQAESQQALQGLDFGSGPGPTLSLMFKEAGFECHNFDLYFANHPELLNLSYDFIVSTEVFEHLRQPEPVIRQLLSCLKPGGYLGIMTQRPRDLEAFKRWHYLMDPTHITFYSEACFDWLAQHWGLQKVYMGKSTLVLRKRSC